MIEELHNLYRVFAKYKRPESFDYCPCCMTEDEKLLLLSRPLQQLDAAELGSYAADVLYTVGGEADFKYFLPRMLELSVTDAGWWPRPEILGKKLVTAGWHHWPNEDRTAILDLLEKTYLAALTQALPVGDEIDSRLCVLAHCVTDISGYLDVMLQDEMGDALFAYVDHHLTFYQKHVLNNEFWQDTGSENRQRVCDWLYHDKIRQLLFDNYGMQI
ncbi:MAG: hypothetical protein OEZ39_11475 [Gammaproteobacteria bacterium]|nr:hypothetical protein [Gammaproteobacteria bacterium]MDH5652463.1 hypothetical protein [Gammaproteobacteria bacterium]